MPHQNNTILKLLYSTKETIQKTRTFEDVNSTKRANYSSYNTAHLKGSKSFGLSPVSAWKFVKHLRGIAVTIFIKNLVEKTLVSNVQRLSFKCYRRILVCIVHCGLIQWFLFLLVVITTAGRRSFLGPIRKNWKSKLEQPDGFARTKSASNSAFFSTVNEKKTLFSA